MKVAVITARGGSKRIPRKNILEFHGKPMIAWSIGAAISSNIFDRIVVSTDDDEIAAIATEYGAEVPFRRPVDLADDYSTTLDVMAHATAWLDDSTTGLESVCCIYPTAPFLVPQDVVAGYQALRSGDWSYAFSASNYDPAVFRSFSFSPNGGVSMVFPQYRSTRSQDLPQLMCDAAQFYWGAKNAWLERKPIFQSYSKPVLIPSWRVIDIDEPEDLQQANQIAPDIFRRISLR